MIEKSALLLTRGSWPESELLLVREHGKAHWIFPGGKQEVGESSEQALRREVREELNAEVTQFSDLGVVQGYTPDGRDLRIHLYCGEIDGEPQASSEISALNWLSRADLRKVFGELTPITVEKVFPMLAHMRIW
ncbi:NUDIX domain-containing protein [Actinomadura sp. 6K520]|jgi:8-oxo-dGTP diphosphatase|uniref:NUDIX hydrolase n=1 Tax=Actinomadura sp. 6K520 TaxID=2530364 RepID=UPI0014051C31|nr:NUDIX domain-containing protein [Actinomadura sp. 6K520]